MEMKVLMSAHVFWAVGLVSHSLTAASNSPELKSIVPSWFALLDPIVIPLD